MLSHAVGVVPRANEVYEVLKECIRFMVTGLCLVCWNWGVKMPEDIQLITYANKVVPLLFHKPVPRVEFDVEAQAERAVEMMDGRLVD